MSDANSEFDPNHGADPDPGAARTGPLAVETDANWRRIWVSS